MRLAADRIAVISDIHGNMTAFEAVLADTRARGIETIYCLGDLIGKGPSGAAVIDLCRELCVATLQGNWDVLVGSSGHTWSNHPINIWNREQLDDEQLNFLATLPATAEFALSGKRVRLFHASQVSAFHRVRQYDPLETHLAMFGNTDFTGDGPRPDIVGYGDIHIGYVKTLPAGCLFNAGSVGNPLDIPLACYAVLEGAYQSDVLAPWSVSLIRVPYDIEAAIREGETSGMPELAEYAGELRTARYRGLARGAG